jgi:hypothetical protein
MPQTDGKLRVKLAPKAIKCLFVGYEFNHSAHTYRLYNPKTRHIILSRDVRWDYWNTKDSKQALREPRQVYMQHLVNKNPNGWSDHQKQQFNNLIDQYIQPQHTPLPEEMPPYLDYADYNLVSADGSHLTDFQPPNEVEEPPPLLEEPEHHQWLAEEQQEQELEGHEEVESEEEEEEEIKIIEDSDDEVEQRAPRANRELKSLGIIPKSSIPREVQKLNTSYNPTYTAHVNLTISSDPGKPKTMKEALLGPKNYGKKP